MQFHGRIGGNDAFQQGGQQLPRDPFHRHDAQPPVMPAGQGVDLFFRPGGILHHGHDMTGHDRAHFRQHHAIGQAVEQGGADFGFHLRKLAGQGGWRDIQPARGLTDRPAFPHGIEIGNAPRMQPHHAGGTGKRIIHGLVSSPFA